MQRIDKMDYDKINLKIVINEEILAIPCSMAVSPDGDKLILVFQEDQFGAVKELRYRIAEEGKRFE